MKRAILTLFLSCVSACTMAGDKPPIDPALPEHAAVMSELSQRSGLPETQLNQLLAQCNATQQSMYFCAWRDQIAAERTLRRTLEDKQRKTPQCKTRIERQIASWTKSRDQSCEKSAIKEWGDGSMKPTAQAICVTAATVRMTERLERMDGCVGASD